jgi:hypothetical protein
MNGSGSGNGGGGGHAPRGNAGIALERKLRHELDRLGGFTPSQAAALFRLDAREVDRRLQTLYASGLADRTEGSYNPLPPYDEWASGMDEDEEELDEELDEALDEALEEELHEGRLEGLGERLAAWRTEPEYLYTHPTSSRGGSGISGTSISDSGISGAKDARGSEDSESGAEAGPDYERAGIWSSGLMAAKNPDRAHMHAAASPEACWTRSAFLAHLARCSRPRVQLVDARVGDLEEMGGGNSGDPLPVAPSSFTVLRTWSANADSFETGLYVVPGIPEQEPENLPAPSPENIATLRAPEQRVDAAVLALIDTVSARWSRSLRNPDNMDLVEEGYWPDIPTTLLFDLARDADYYRAGAILAARRRSAKIPNFLALEEDLKDTLVHPGSLIFFCGLDKFLSDNAYGVEALYPLEPVHFNLRQGELAVVDGLSLNDVWREASVVF